MPVAMNDVIQMTIEGKCFGQDIQYTQAWQMNGPGPGGTSVAQNLLTMCNDVINGITNNILTTYQALIPSNWTLSNVTFQVIHPVRSAYQFVNGTIQAGTWTGSATIAAEAGCITFIGELGNRHNVSNKHIGPIASNASSLGMLQPAWKVAGGNFINAILTPWSPTGFAGSQLVSGVWDRVGHIFTKYFTGTVQDESRVQRRRVVGYGK